MTQTASCLLCHGPLGKVAYPHATRFGGDQLLFRACNRCGAHSLAPAPRPEVLAGLYADGTYHGAFYADPNPGAHDRLIRLLGGQLPRGARVLDYGCGNGDFLLAARAAGFEAEGAEFGPGASARASDRAGVPVYDLSTGPLPAEPAWDAVHLGDVLEHLVDPSAILAGLVARLRPGGLVAAQGPLELQPSLVGAAIRVHAAVKHRRGVIGSFTPWHLTYADARAQRALFRRAGLGELFWQVDESGWPYAGQAGLRGLIGRLAAGMAALPGLRGRLGNRFTALYRKPDGAEPCAE